MGEREPLHKMRLQDRSTALGYARDFLSLAIISGDGLTPQDVTNLEAIVHGEYDGPTAPGAREASSGGPELTPDQAVIISVFTGVMCCTEKAWEGYVSGLMKRHVNYGDNRTQEESDLIKRRARADFIALIPNAAPDIRGREKYMAMGPYGEPKTTRRWMVTYVADNEVGRLFITSRHTEISEEFVQSVDLHIQRTFPGHRKAFVAALAPMGLVEASTDVTLEDVQ